MPDIEEKTKEEEVNEEANEKVSEEAKEANTDFDSKLDDEFNEDTGDENNSADDNADDNDPADNEDTEESKEAEDKAEEKEETPAVSEQLLERAKNAGFKESQIEKFSPESLEIALDAIDSGKQETPEEDGDTEQKKDDKSEEGKEEKTALDDFDLDQFDEQLSGAIKAVNQENTSLKNEVTQLKQQVESVLNEGKERQVVEFADRMDKLFSEAEDYQDIFGNGKGFEMPEDSTEFKNREKVLEEMDALVAGYGATKKEIPPTEVVFERAVQNVFKEESKKAAVRPVKKKLKERSQQTIGKPKGGNKTITGQEKALQANLDFDSKLDDEV